MRRTPVHSLTQNVGDRRVFWPESSCCTAWAWSSFVPLLQEVSSTCKTRNQLSVYFFFFWVRIRLAITTEGTLYGQNIQTHCSPIGYALPGWTRHLEFHGAFAHTASAWKTLSKGERGMDWKQLLGSITTSVDEELRLRNAYLVAENRLLRQQINR